MSKCVPFYFNFNVDSEQNYDKTFYLPEVISTENYVCGIKHLSGKITSSVKKTERLFLCSDICQESFVNSTKIPVICEIIRNIKGNITNNIENVTWLKILRPNISTVRLYICDEKGKPLSLTNPILRGTLLFAYSP